jgi:hypothetical protein
VHLRLIAGAVHGDDEVLLDVRICKPAYSILPKENSDHSPKLRSIAQVVQSLEPIIRVGEITLVSKISHRDPDATRHEGIRVNSVNVTGAWAIELEGDLEAGKVGSEAPNAYGNSIGIEEVLPKIDVSILVLGDGSSHDRIASDSKEGSGLSA